MGYGRPFNSTRNQLSHKNWTTQWGQARLANDTPDRIRFRVVANIAACQLELGKEDIAAEGFIDAWELAPDDPKAIANKAFGLLLKEDWPVLMAFAMEQLPKHPDNAALAGCYIHGLIIDETVTDDQLSHKNWTTQWGQARLANDT